MIPKNIHFINIGVRPFHFVHLLAILTAYKVNKDYKIYIHLTDEPTGQWWAKAKKYCTIKYIDRINSVFDNPIGNPAHMADVLRLKILSEMGGIYLDLDVVCINPFQKLLKNNFVMGLEPGSGLCNAVILSDSKSSFLKKWRDSYKTFDTNKWNYHSVKLPWIMSNNNKEEINIESKYSFFYPLAEDPAHLYLWGKRPTFNVILKRILKNILGYSYYSLFKRYDKLNLIKYKTFHLLFGQNWHYNKARNSYCIHLWEGFWKKPYLNEINPDYLLNNKNNFAKLMRQVIDENTIKELKK